MVFDARREKLDCARHENPPARYRNRSLFSNQWNAHWICCFFGVRFEPWDHDSFFMAEVVAICVVVSTCSFQYIRHRICRSCWLAGFGSTRCNICIGRFFGNCLGPKGSCMDCSFICRSIHFVYRARPSGYIGLPVVVLFGGGNFAVDAESHTSDTT